jgi:hypothetical protein
MNMPDSNRPGRLPMAAGAAASLMLLLLAPVVAQRPQQAVPAGPWMNKDLPPDQRADMVVAQMTLDEKISLAHGPGGFQAAGPRSNGGAGMIPGIPRLGLPDVLAEFVKGMQSQKVIGDVKHYAFNDQENGRNSYNVKMDKRTMRETDLLAFEIAITEGQPGMVMCSYNKVNGDYACENSYLLNDLLKKTWGFKGFVVSDWNATHSTAKAAINGLDNEQPGGDVARSRFGDALKKAVESGEVPPARLDDIVHRIVRTEFAMGIVDDPPQGPCGRSVPRRGYRADRSRGGLGAVEERGQSASAERIGRHVYRDHRLTR